jgi:hypothetical protein
MPRLSRALLVLVAAFATAISVLAMAGCSAQSAAKAQHVIVEPGGSQRDLLRAYQALIGLPRDDDPKLYVEAATNKSLPPDSRKIACALFFKRFLLPPRSLRSLLSTYPEMKQWFDAAVIRDASADDQTGLGTDTSGMSVFEIEDRAGNLPVWIDIGVMPEIEKQDLINDVRNGTIPKDLRIMEVEVTGW